MLASPRKTALSGILAFLMAVLFTSAAFAQFTGDVRVSNRVIFRFHDSDYDAAQERARVVQDRIDALMNTGLGPSDVKLAKDDGHFIITWGDEIIVTIDPAQAKLNEMTPQALGESWVNNFKKALVEAGLFIVPSFIEIPIGASTAVKAGGFAKGPISLVSDGGNVAVDINQEKGEIKVTGTGLGKSKLVFARGSARTALMVQILDLPANIPEKIETEVSGDPAPKEVLRYAARNAVRGAIRVKSGAVMEVGKEVRVARTLERFRSVVAHVPVVIKGPGFFTLDQEVKIVIKNTGEGFDDCNLLMISDRPEQFNQDGTLFHGKLDAKNPARLLYFHQNSDTKNRRFWIELKNTSNRPVHVMTGGALGGPSRWGVTVGHVAAMRFLEMYQSGIGYTIQIQPGDSVSLIDLQVGPEQVLCGYFHLKIRQGAELDILVKNSQKLDGDSNGMPLPLLSQPFDPFKIHPKGVFKPANLVEDIEFDLKEDTEGVSCVIGSAPWLIDPVTGEPNNGNYGVFYRFKIKMKNPTSETRRVGFYFTPQGLLARGSFILDGRLMETGMVRNPSRVIFAAVDLLPNSEKTVTLVTTPEGGSYYPVEISIKEIDRDIGIKKERNLNGKEESENRSAEMELKEDDQVQK